MADHGLRGPDRQAWLFEKSPFRADAGVSYHAGQVGETHDDHATLLEFPADSLCMCSLAVFRSYNSLLQQRTKLEDLEKVPKEEQMRMALEKEQNRTTAAECCRLRDEKDR